MKKHLFSTLFLLIFIVSTNHHAIIAETREKQTLPMLKLVCHSTIGVGGVAEVDVAYHGNLELKGCEVIISYDTSVVSYSNHSSVNADFKLVKIKDSQETIKIDGFFYPSASGDIPILTLHFTGVAEGGSQCWNH